jgi:hypothetical protein
MIELPHEFLNALLVLLVIFATASRSRQRMGAERASAARSVSFYR